VGSVSQIHEGRVYTPAPLSKKTDIFIRTTGERNFILNEHNISGKNFRFISFADNERVVCELIYIFYYYYY